MIDKYEKYIKEETLSNEIISDKDIKKEYTLNSENVFIDIKKI